MRAKGVLIALVICAGLGIISYLIINRQSSNTESEQGDNSIAEGVISTMKLTSSSFKNKSDIPAKYTCDDQDINPPLSISEVPEEAKSLVLIVDDPDAPGGDWVHWLVWNIDPKLTGIAEGEVPEGSTQGLNDFGKGDYGGPCPPSGKHRYQFKLYALDAVLDLAPTTKKQELLTAVQEHILDQALLVGYYQKE